MKLLRARWFHALWIGAMVLALAIWFELVWAGCAVVLGMGFAMVALDWLMSLLSPESRPRRRLLRR